MRNTINFSLADKNNQINNLTDVKSFEVAEREILLYDTFLDMLLLRGIRGRPVLYNIRRHAGH